MEEHVHGCTGLEPCNARSCERSSEGTRLRGTNSLTIHPNVSPRYYGYYLSGFQEILGSNLRFTTRGMPKIQNPTSGMALILPEGERIFLAANDHAVVSSEAVEWADVVGQVNVDPRSDLPDNVVPIGPSFGTPWGSRAGLAAFILRAGLRADPAKVPAMMRDYLRNEADRSPLSMYTPQEGAHDNVYFLASYWGQSPEANARRLHFVKAVERARGITLTGGFWSPRALPADYSAHQVRDRVDHSAYLDRTRRSMAVFNTPAVHDCLGWKLGEFLALGKAIISTPLGRCMPGEFRSGEQFHQVEDDEEAILAALQEIAENHFYRRHLEKGARRYWEDYLAPISVARRLIAATASTA